MNSFDLSDKRPQDVSDAIVVMNFVVYSFLFFLFFSPVILGALDLSDKRPQVSDAIVVVNFVVFLSSQFGRSRIV